MHDRTALLAITPGRHGRNIHVYLLPLLALHLLTICADAQPVQWKPVENLAGEIRGLVTTADGRAYALGMFSLYYSENCGRTWERLDEISEGDGGLPGEYVTIAGLDDGTILCGLDPFQIWTYRDGENLYDFYFGDAPELETDNLRLLASDEEDNVYAVIGDGLYRSEGDEEPWVWLYEDPGLANATAIAVDEHGTVFVATRGGLLRGTDEGTKWDDLSSFLPRRSASALAITSDGELWITSAEGYVALSLDSGATWERRDAGLPPESFTTMLARPDGLILVASSTGGIYRSADSGRTWHASTGIPRDACCHSLSATLGDTLLIVSGVEGTYRSTDAGRTWKPSNTGMSCDGISAVAVDTLNTVYAVISSMWGVGEAIVTSGDGGHSWRDLTGSLRNTDPGDLGLSCRGYLYVTTRYGALNRRKPGGSDEWRQVVPAVDSSDAWYTGQVYVPAFGNTGVVAFETGDKVLGSADDGATWDTLVFNSDRMDATVDSDGVLYIATMDSLYRARHNGIQWQVTATPTGALDIGGILATRKGTLCATNRRGRIACDTGLYISRDGGDTWQAVPASAALSCDVTTDATGTVILAIAEDRYLLWSRDEGRTWQKRGSYPDMPYEHADPLVLTNGEVLISGSGGNSERFHRSLDKAIDPTGKREGQLRPIDTAALDLPGFEAFYQRSCNVVGYRFFLHRKCNVTLEIYRGLDTHVATFPLGELDPGSHAGGQVITLEGSSTPHYIPYHAVIRTPFETLMDKIWIY